MRIVIDLQGAQTESRLRGIGRYSISLVRAILEESRQRHDIWLFANSSLPGLVGELKEKLGASAGNARWIIFQGPTNVAGDSVGREFVRRSAEKSREYLIASVQPDVVLITSLFEGGYQSDAIGTVRIYDQKTAVVTILYDLIPLQNPDKYLGSAWPRKWYEEKFANLKRAQKLLAISEFSRVEGINLGKFAADSIVNISTAHDQALFNPENAAKFAVQTRHELNISSRIILYNGAVEERKNIRSLIEAFSRLPAKVKEACTLVIAGKGHDIENASIDECIERFSVRNLVRRVGWISDNELVGLMGASDVFVFPSLQEGFGLPALEAMACGLATIASNTTSLPEVIGNSRALFDPNNIAEQSNLLCKVLSDDTFRRNLEVTGLQQSENFSWKKSAQIALESMSQFSLSSPKRSEYSDETAEARYSTLIESIAQDHQNLNADKKQLIEVAGQLASIGELADTLSRFDFTDDSLPSWRIEGPFDSSYSLALVNRELALAMKQIGVDVALHSTEGGGDFSANVDFLQKHPSINALHGRSLQIHNNSESIVSRNLYPPRVNDMGGRVNMLHSYGWEESGFPHCWATDFNKHLNLLTVMSKHVKKTLIDAGVSLPSYVAGVGVDHWLNIQPKEIKHLESKEFRFLHVSSCFPRKGIDCLLKAYGSAFTSADNVSLIIKTFANPHNEVHKLLANERAANQSYPHVVIWEEDLSDQMLKGLYEKCHVLIAPSRAEGFGLPIAEAMLSGLPVITTGWSGQLDFVSSESTWLIDFDFTQAQTHFGLFSSVWADPKIDHLSQLMQTAFRTPIKDLQARAASGAQQLLQSHRWVDVARRQTQGVLQAIGTTNVDDLKVGWITTWNIRCGIAAYSYDLLEHFEAEYYVLADQSTDLNSQDQDNVCRCWAQKDGENLANLKDQIVALKLNSIVIQFNFGFFDLSTLSEFIFWCERKSLTVVIALHSTTSPIGVENKRFELLLDALKVCSRVLVHSIADLNRMKHHGLLENVTLFPLGVRTHQGQTVQQMLPTERVRAIFRIATYGFFLPHKGLLETIEAVALLKQRGKSIQLFMVNAEYPIKTSSDAIAQAKQLVVELDVQDLVVFHTDFTDHETSLDRLRSCDLVVFGYQQTGESASAAVRTGLSSEVPVAVTPIPIFCDLSDAVYRFSGTEPTEIADSLLKIEASVCGRDSEFQKVLNRANQWRQEHQFSSLSERIRSMMIGLRNQSN
jgi:O-antigen biosynthesis alpha-1,2-mannosyltransferase